MGQRQDDQAPRGGEKREKGNLYEEVTARVVAELEQGRVPWVQPWGAGRAALGLPRNALSGQSYSGINILILWGAVIDGGYPSQFWLTYRQALALDGHVRKGERGVSVCYADRFTPKGETERAEDLVRQHALGLAAKGRDRACGGGGRRAKFDPVPEAVHRVQCGAVRGTATFADGASCSLAGTDGA